MKKSLFILAMCFLTIISCQTDTNELTDETAIETIETITPNAQRIVTGLDDLERARFEHALQWLSYLTVETLMVDRDAAIDFLIKLNGDNTIALEELLGNGGASSVPSAFESRFREVLYCYIADCGHGDGNTITPPRPVTGTLPGGGFGDPFLEIANKFIQELLDDYCIELYIPETLNFSGDNDYVITSTAHPLNTDDFNEGIRRYTSPRIIIVDDESILSSTEYTVVDDAYVNVNGNVIVARPFREYQPGSICDYNGYPDFTDFLD